MTRIFSLVAQRIRDVQPHTPAPNPSRGGRTWSLFTAIVAVGLYWAAISRGVYEVTSPSYLSWHVALRKLYSVIAFAVLGLLVARGIPPRSRVWMTVLILAIYSAAIEVGQYLTGVREGLVWNTVDTLCGALGGAFGAIICNAFGSQKRRKRE
jgi:hypothetical protein